MLKYRMPRDGRAEPPELTPDELARLRSALNRMVELGMGVVYGEEDEGVPDAHPGCAEKLSECKARCCTLHFALTREEVAMGHILHDPERPYHIARDADGYCPHLGRADFKCAIWERRPTRCRRYACEAAG